MAILRWFYRKRHVIFICLCASTFWVIYLFLSLPNSSTKSRTRPVYAEHRKSVTKDVVSLSRSHFTILDTGQRKPESNQKKPNNNVLEQPKVIIEEKERKVPKKENKGQDAIKQSQDGKNEGKGLQTADDKHPKGKLTEKGALNLKPSNNSVVKTPKEAGNFEKVIQMGEKLKNKTIEIGQKFKNKTLEVGEQVRNKTIEKLSELGVIQQKNFIKYIHVPSAWKLNLSLEDIGKVMKDTEFLNKQAKIDINYPKLLPVKTNRTEGNVTIALRNVTMANAVGYCNCVDYDCMCCAQVSDKLMHFNGTTCANITYISKSQEFDFRFILDKTLLYKNIISAEKPPQVCLSSRSKVAALCTRFLSVSSQVKVEEMHKLSIIGCVEFSVTLYNKTVSAFPVDCFEVPSQQHHRKEHEKLHDFVNWMP